MAPDGQTSQLIAYSFGDEIGPVQASGASESLALTTALRADLGRTWRIEGYAAFAQEIGTSLNANLINSAYLTEALGGSDNASTGFRATRDGYLNPYGDGGANSAAILDFISSGYSRARNVSRWPVRSTAVESRARFCWRKISRRQLAPTAIFTSPAPS